MMVCPVCGALLVQPRQNSLFVDKELYVPEERILAGCHCWTSLEALEQAFQAVRDSLSRIAKDRFVGTNWDEIMQEVMELPKKSPLRGHILNKRRLLDRARESIERKRKELAEDAAKSRQKKQAHEKGMEGKRVSLREFLDSFGE